MKKLLAWSLGAAIFVSVVSAEDKLYKVEVNGQLKGAMTLSAGTKKLLVDYYNISNHDKIAFYAKKKELQLTSLDGRNSVAALTVDGKKSKVMYDLSSLSTQMLENAGVGTDEVKSRAIIYSADSTSSVDKIPVLTMETLIEDIFRNKNVYTKPFYLYEPQGKMMIKLIMKEEGRQTITLKGKKCDTKVWLLSIFKRNKSLARIYTNPFPVKIEAFSKRWSLVIEGIGSQKQHIVQKAKIFFDHKRKELEAKYRSYNIKIISQDSSVFPLKTTFVLTKDLDNDEVKRKVQSYLNDASVKPFRSSLKDDLVYKIDTDAVVDAMKEDYEAIDMRSYWKTVVLEASKQALQKMALKKHPKCAIDNEDSEKLLCGEDRKSIDLEDYIKPFVEQKGYKKYEKLDVDEKDGYFTVSFKIMQTFDNKQQEIYIYKALAKEFDGIQFNRLPLLKRDLGFEVHINSKGIRNYTCNAIMPYESVAKESECMAKIIQTHPANEVDSLIRNYISDTYPLIDILGVKVRNENDQLSFTYRSDLSKVTDACK